MSLLLMQLSRTESRLHEVHIYLGKVHNFLLWWSWMHVLHLMSKMLFTLGIVVKLTLCNNTISVHISFPENLHDNTHLCSWDCSTIGCSTTIQYVCCNCHIA